MKKNISINLQGLIFHIEEDGYEVLGRYLAEVRAHFSGYPGHEEIVADIEGRIAELFAARLSSTKQVITLSDVEEMTAKMGRVSEFQSADELDEDELEQAVATGRMPQADPAAAADTAAADAEPRRLYRDIANRKIAGVAAGIARYFSVNPLWIRLGFLALLFLPNILFHRWTDGDNGNLDLPGISFLLYIILWIVLPKKYDATPADEDPTFKKLYRDTDNGKVGGVSAGLAAYFKTDVVVFRLLFVLGVFAGGFAIPLYIVLWILLPEAKTASDRLRMRGDAVTLSGIDSSVRNQAVDGSSGRPVGTFLEEFFRNLSPLFSVLGTLLRVAAAAFLIIIGFSLLIGTIIMLGAGLGVFTSEQFEIDGVAAYTVLGDFPGWFLLSAFLAAFIPALAMLLAGLGLLLRRSILSRTASLTLLGLWLLGIVGSVMGGVHISRNFQREGDQTQDVSFPQLNARTVRLELRDLEEGKWTGSVLQVADSGQVLSVLREASARGVTEEEAARTAGSSVSYQMRSLNDSTLVFDNHFRIAAGSPLRGQELLLTIRLPRDRRYRMSRDFAYWLGSEFFVGNNIPEDVADRTFQLRGNKLECIGCPPSTDNDNDDNDNDDFDIDVDSDGSSINIDLGKPDFDTDLNGYGSGRRTFNVDDFNTIEASGAYRIVVRRGDTYQIEAAGEERDISQLRIETVGDGLRIRSIRDGLFGFSGTREPILIRVQMPELIHLDLSGACRADVSGFEGKALQIEQSGASTAKLDVNVPRLELDLSGACNTAVRGKATELDIDGSGVCKIEALSLQTNRASIDLSGASRARVRVAERLQAEVTGSSHVHYAGNPANVQKDESGGSRVRAITSADADEDTATDEE
ncbi:PspC domain-containing protein [Hymenobacter guriensis]|uniref:PspC domain-containing protein n=1 Tax=Hymenobacter guriensis TaxID=2793065 RepID=A0ABS0KXM0_9BACT|nr:PspC domain-containing protein [Hymenobacter guriensis]MBG8551954.1 PspC domain-containing protein [Hymenobacter guriensis]